MADRASGELIRCESAGNCNDGFAASNFGGKTPATETEWDCWFHDNGSQGTSIHWACAQSIVGGVYEWNRGGGQVTYGGAASTAVGSTFRHHRSGIGVSAGGMAGWDGTHVSLRECAIYSNDVSVVVAGNGTNDVLEAYNCRIDGMRGCVWSYDVPHVVRMYGCYSTVPSDLPIYAGNGSVVTNFESRMFGLAEGRFRGDGALLTNLSVSVGDRMLATNGVGATLELFSAGGSANLYLTAAAGQVANVLEVYDPGSALVTELSPAGKLTLGGGASISGTVTVSSVTGKPFLIFTNGSALTNPAVTVDAAGNLGVGRVPGGGYRVEVKGNVTADAAYFSAGNVSIASGNGFKWVGLGGVDSTAEGVFNIYDSGSTGTNAKRVVFGASTTNWPALAKHAQYPTNMLAVTDGAGGASSAGLVLRGMYFSPTNAVTIGNGNVCLFVTNGVLGAMCVNGAGVLTFKQLAP